jgi:hypothetical protein
LNLQVAPEKALTETQCNTKQSLPRQQNELMGERLHIDTVMQSQIFLVSAVMVTA